MRAVIFGKVNMDRNAPEYLTEKILLRPQNYGWKIRAEHFAIPEDVGLIAKYVAGEKINV